MSKIADAILPTLGEQMAEHFDQGRWNEKEVKQQMKLLSELDDALTNAHDITIRMARRGYDVTLARFYIEQAIKSVYRPGTALPEQID